MCMCMRSVDALVNVVSMHVCVRRSEDKLMILSDLSFLFHFFLRQGLSLAWNVLSRL